MIDPKQLIMLLWKQALGGDSRVSAYLADRMFGRVKAELDHAAVGPIEHIFKVVEVPAGEASEKDT